MKRPSLRVLRELLLGLRNQDQHINVLPLRLTLPRSLSNSPIRLIMKDLTRKSSLELPLPLILPLTLTLPMLSLKNTTELAISSVPLRPYLNGLHPSLLPLLFPSLPLTLESSLTGETKLLMLPKLKTSKKLEELEERPLHGSLTTMSTKRLKNSYWPDLSSLWHSVIN